MTGLDTNVLVRYLTGDDPRQAAIAESEIEAGIARKEKFLVHPVVLCELIWVLETAYGSARAELVMVLDRILRTAQFDVPAKDVAWRALADFRKGKGDFSDYLIARSNESGGALTTLTFDKDLRKDRLFRVLA